MPSPSCLPSTLNCSCSPANSGVDMLRSTDRRSERRNPMVQRRLPHPEPVEPPRRPRLADQPSRFVLLEREVELEYRPQMLEALQRKVNTVAEEARATVPECQCGRPMTYHDARPVSWLAHWGPLHSSSTVGAASWPQLVDSKQGDACQREILVSRLICK